MNAFEMKLVPALVAMAAIAGAVFLAVRDNAQMAAAMAIVGVVVQTFLPPAVKRVSPSDRITDPEIGGGE